MKLKDLLNETILGELPSSKLMKMKWNPLKEKQPVTENQVLNVSQEDMDKLHEGGMVEINGITLKYQDATR